MQQSQQVLLPVGALGEVAHYGPRRTAPILRISAVERLDPARPGRDRPEVVQLHAGAQGAAPCTPGQSRLLVQLVAVEGVRADPEDVSVLTGEEGLAQDHQAIRIEEMIAVDPQHPARRGGVLLELPMRLCGVRAATDFG